MKILYLLLFLSIASGSSLVAQKKPIRKAPAKATEYKPDTTADEKKVRDIISFLEYMLNTLGSSGTPSRDKDVLITESYSKIFRDAKVQVEDDLDEERKVITNKDIVAYLKDVNFFFTNVRFEFAIEDIKGQPLSNGQYFYKVSSRRTLTGTTADGQMMKNTIPRFLEINYDPKNQDLKIVSIYTNEFNEKEALTTWWNDLSLEWRSVFKEKLNLRDSVGLREIKQAMAITALDVRGNSYLQDIQPLAQLINLRSLNIANTPISDLTPIRNLTELISLDFSNTTVSDLTPLRYATKLQHLNFNNTKVTDIGVLEKMPELVTLDFSGTRTSDGAVLSTLLNLERLALKETRITSLASLSSLAALTHLNLSGTPVEDLTPLRELTNLQDLDIDSTRVKTLQPLMNLENLTILRANYTSFSDLSPLQKLKRLTKVYCDHTPVQREAAEAFMLVNPSVLIIYDSDDMNGWWRELSTEWKQVFVNATGIRSAPTKEELAKIPLLDSLNTHQAYITTLEPLRKLSRLKKITLNKTAITDLSPLKDHREILYLDISETEVKDISVMNRFAKLQTLRTDHCPLENSIKIKLPLLKIWYADHTNLSELTAIEFLKQNPQCLLVYKTDSLRNWWQSLSETWKGILSSDSNITREKLHAIILQEKLQIKDVPITDLTPLIEFIQLKELHFSGTLITTLSVDGLKSLSSLHATSSPLQDIKSISALTQLVELDISNTPIEDIYEIWRLGSLKKLNCAGTQIKRLEALEKLEKLEYFDCSNTNVNKLGALSYLPLKILKCYNTNVSNREIENFKASHPDCQVIYYR